MVATTTWLQLTSMLPNEPSAVAIEEQLIDQLGEAPKRVRRAPKFLYVYRENKARKKKTVTVAGGEIEVLAEGQQFVASGITQRADKNMIGRVTILRTIGPTNCR